jgi:aryl-alcohol dehydrogenase-like predicted oxidoreductase
MLVATKGGLTRPRGDWIADGRARHLGAACEASRRALGVERIDLYQLHAPDPRTPFSTSVRALAALQRDGLIEHVGLCNVNVGQIEEARRITDIAAVQVELSVWHDDSFRSETVRWIRVSRVASAFSIETPASSSRRRPRRAWKITLGEAGTVRLRWPAAGDGITGSGGSGQKMRT